MSQPIVKILREDLRRLDWLGYDDADFDVIELLANEIEFNELFEMLGGRGSSEIP